MENGWPPGKFLYKNLIHHKLHLSQTHKIKYNKDNTKGALK